MIEFTKLRSCNALAVMELATSTATITFTIIVASVSRARFIELVIGTFHTTLCLDHGRGEETDDDDEDEESSLEESHRWNMCCGVVLKVKIRKCFINNWSEAG